MLLPYEPIIHNDDISRRARRTPQNNTNNKPKQYVVFNSLNVIKFQHLFVQSFLVPFSAPRLLNMFHPISGGRGTGAAIYSFSSPPAFQLFSEILDRSRNIKRGIKKYILRDNDKI